MPEINYADLVAVICLELDTSSGNKKSYGTAYAVAKDLVITARHVLYPPDTADIKIHGIKSCKLIWKKSDSKLNLHDCIVEKEDIIFECEKSDIALVNCDTGSLVLSEYNKLATEFPLLNQSLTMWGYPDFKETSTEREKTSAALYCEPVDKNNRYFEVRSSKDLNDKWKDWSGASGSPVIDEKTGILYGILCKYDLPSKGSSEAATKKPFDTKIFTITSLPYLQREGKCQKFVKFISDWRSNYDVWEHVAEFLNQNSSVLANINKIFSVENIKGFASQDELCSQIEATKQASAVNSVEEIQCLESFIRLLIPVFYSQQELVSFINQILDKPIITTAVCKPFSAEMLMAAYDGREPELNFHDVSERNKRKTATPKTFCLNKPPEGGSTSPEDDADVLLQQIAVGSGLDDDTLLKDRAVVVLCAAIAGEEPSAKTTEDKQFVLNRELNRREKDEEVGTYYWYFSENIGQESKTRSEQIADLIFRHHPKIKTLHLEQNVHKAEDEKDKLQLFHKYLDNKDS